jgi:hypothetical protein
VEYWAGYRAWEERRAELVREVEHRRLVRELRLDALRSGEEEETAAGRWRKRLFGLVGASAG